MQGGQPFYVENIFEELDNPGEWFLDENESILYYYPETSITSSIFVAGILDNVIELRWLLFLSDIW